MFEDDIQYLGRRMSQRPSYTGVNRPFNPQRPVAGIALHVESGDQPAYGMLFRRSHFKSLDIGRRPGGTNIEKRHEPTDCGRAMFRCPVISRKHAKITFSDSGHAYLTDLNSHHGTYVLKSTDLVHRKIKPETPTLLADGDIVTFGKTVGKDGQAVAPVVARIELLFDSPIMSCLSPARTVKPPTPIESPTEPAKTHSGRYGLYVPSSHGSDDSSQYDPDSDIEALDGPPSPSRPTPRENSPSTPGDLPSPLEFRELSPLYYEHHRFHPFDHSPSPLPQSPLRYSPIGCSDDVFGTPSRSKSTSPMDLSSPSPAASIPGDSEPNSRQLSSPTADTVEQSQSPEPAETTTPHDDVITSVAEPASDSAPVVSSTPSLAPESERPVAAVIESPVISQDIARHESVEERPGGSSSLLPLTPPHRAPLNDHYAAELLKFSREYMTPSKTATKLADLDKQVQEIYSMCSSLADQVGDVTEIDVPDLQTTVEYLQDQVEGITAKEDAPNAEPAALASLEENINTLNMLVNETKALRENAERQIAAEVESVAAARMAALAAIESPVQTPPPTSLKRKRSDDDEGEDPSVGHVAISGGPGGGATLCPAMRSMDEIGARSCKRTRRIVSTLVHTATAITVGAVATWSVLAFS